MQGNLSLSPRAKQAYGNFQHLAAASPPRHCPGQRVDQIADQIADQIVHWRGVSLMPFLASRLSQDTRLLCPSPRTFDDTAETDVHDDNVMEVGSQNCVVEIPRSRLAERD
jgi:hypothetical protein